MGEIKSEQGRGGNRASLGHSINANGDVPLHVGLVNAVPSAADTYGDRLTKEQIDSIVRMSESLAGMDKERMTMNNDDLGSGEEIISLCGLEGLSLRGLVFGISVGIFQGFADMYFLLKISATLGSAIYIFVFGLLYLWVKVPGINHVTPTAVENVVAQTASTASSSMVFASGVAVLFIAALPSVCEATDMPGDDCVNDVFYASPTTVLSWSFILSYWGIFLAIPLRRQFIEKLKLPFPGPVTTAFITAKLYEGTAGVQEAIRQLKMMLQFGFLAFLLVNLDWFFQGWLNLPVFGVETSAYYWYTWSFYFSPALFGTGMIVPRKIAVSMTVGMIFAYFVVIPFIKPRLVGWGAEDSDSFEGAKSYYYIVAIIASSADAIYMITKGFIQIATNRYNEDQRLTMGVRVEMKPVGDQPDPCPPWVWIVGLIVNSVAITFLVPLIFDEVVWWQCLISIVSAIVMAYGFIKLAGECNIFLGANGGKLVIICFALGGTGTMACVILGQLSIAAMCQANMMINDFKTGHMLGASPKTMLVAQCIGAIFAAPITTLVYIIFVPEDMTPTTQFPLLGAQFYRSLAVLFREGIDVLPKYSLELAIGTSAFVVLNNAAADFLPSKVGDYTLHGGSFAFGMYLPMYYSWNYLLGHLLKSLMNRSKSENLAANILTIAAGFILGESIAGTIHQFLMFGGLQNPVAVSYTDMGWFPED